MKHRDLDSQPLLQQTERTASPHVLSCSTLPHSMKNYFRDSVAYGTQVILNNPPLPKLFKSWQNVVASSPHKYFNLGWDMKLPNSRPNIVALPEIEPLTFLIRLPQKIPSRMIARTHRVPPVFIMHPNHYLEHSVCSEEFAK